MKKALASFLAAVTMVLTLTATATDVSAQWRRRGWGWGPGVAAGFIGGAVIAGAIIASRPPGYVVYPGYAEPLYGPGCYWASQPVYDSAGRIVGYMGQPVQVCPGYVAPPPPGYAGPPPPGYADPPPPANAAPKRQRAATQQQVQSKEDGKQQLQPKEDSKQQVQPKEQE